MKMLTLALRCLQNDNDAEAVLVMDIKPHPQNFDHRTIIRTWEDVLTLGMSLTVL